MLNIEEEISIEDNVSVDIDFAEDLEKMNTETILNPMNESDSESETQINQTD